LQNSFAEATNSTIDAASNRGIDQIRQLKEKIEFSPSEGKFKVYIIDEVHMLTTEAFNALLKTLEEPPAHVIFILATTDAHKLPPTILSRCQRYDFRLGTDMEIKGLIREIVKRKEITIEEEALDVIVQNDKGSYRDALSILDVIYTGQEEKKKEITLEETRKILGLPDFDNVVLLLKNLLEGNGSKSLTVIEELEEKGESSFLIFLGVTLPDGVDLGALTLDPLSPVEAGFMVFGWSEFFPGLISWGFFPSLEIAPLLIFALGLEFTQTGRLIILPEDKLLAVQFFYGNPVPFGAESNLVEERLILFPAGLTSGLLV